MLLPSVDHLGRPVAHRRRLLAAGLSAYRIRTAVRTGRWQEPLPGVVVGHTGPLTRLERWQAALEYGGDSAALSHRSALLAIGARVEELDLVPRPAGVRGRYELPPEGGLVEITAAHGRHLQSTGFTVVHQSRRPFEDLRQLDGLAVSAPARAAALWRRARVAAEADGAQFHLSANDWSDDLVRQNAIHGTGITLFRFPVRRLRAAPQACGRELCTVVL